jgi:signal transduction histidine kinase
VPNPTIIHLVRLPDALRETCLQAARVASPHAIVRPAANVTEALREPAGGRELLVLAGGDEQEGGRASQALADGDLPRWAVVHLGREPSDLFETVPPEDWNARQLGRIFRSALMQHDLLRENLRLRGDLKTVARRVTHDLRTPLGCILTVCEALKDPAQGGLTAAEMVDAVRTSAEEISKLTDQVSLVLKATLDPVPPLVVRMGPVVAQVLTELPADLARRAQRVRQPAEWPDAIGVPAWLEFMWGQLIHNALRHGSRAGAVQLGWERDGNEVRFWVSSGGAVPPEVRDRLLRPFHLLHQHVSVGLGLPLVERLATLQGGRAGYEATADNRSVFFFTLPAHGEPAPPAPAEKIARSARNLATS